MEINLINKVYGSKIILKEGKNERNMRTIIPTKPTCYFLFFNPVISRMGCGW